MVSTIRFRSFKTINFGWSRSYMKLFGFAALLVFIATEPSIALLIIAYGYLASAFIELVLTRFRGRRPDPQPGG
jgi:phosphatidylserine synthase